MIERQHSDSPTKSSAVYSNCEQFRYELTRCWGKGRRLSYVMLNPSTASETRNDPTVERCERRARAMGFDAFRVVNIFAFRATHPKDLKQADDAIGLKNNQFPISAANWADMVLCAWGAHGAHQKRGAEVEALLRSQDCDLWHLGLTKSGAPRHPLYVAYTQQPTIWHQSVNIPLTHCYKKA